MIYLYIFNYFPFDIVYMLSMTNKKLRRQAKIRFQKVRIKNFPEILSCLLASKEINKDWFNYSIQIHSKYCFSYQAEDITKAYIHPSYKSSRLFHDGIEKSYCHLAPVLWKLFCKYKKYKLVNLLLQKASSISDDIDKIIFQQIFNTYNQFYHHVKLFSHLKSYKLSHKSIQPLTQQRN